MDRHDRDQHEPLENCFTLNEISIFLYNIGWDMPQRLEFCKHLNDFWLALDAEGTIMCNDGKPIPLEEE